MTQYRILINDRLKPFAQFQRFIETLPRTFNLLGIEVYTGRNRLRRIDGLGEVMVKRYHGLLALQKFDYTFLRTPKCRKAYSSAMELRRRGFEVAEELAYLEVRRNGFYQYAFFVAEIAKGERLDRLILRLQESQQHDAITRLTAQLAYFVYQLHLSGVIFEDFNANNIFCALLPDGSTWRFTLIDTNRARFFQPTSLPSLHTARQDLILMRPELGITPQFIADYLRLRNDYTPENYQRILCAHHHRHRRRPLKLYLRRFKQPFFHWLEKR